MSEYELSDIMSFKTMADHFTKKSKIVQNKQEDKDIDRKYFTYKEKRIQDEDQNTFQAYYDRLFKKNKIVKLTGPNKLYEYRTLNYLRRKKNLKKKEIRTWDLTHDDHVVKKKTHSENIYINIIEYLKTRKKDLEKRKKDLEKKSVISEKKKRFGGKNVISDGKNVTTDLSIIKKQYDLTEEQKKLEIIFPHRNEREENEFTFFTQFIEEKDNFETESVKMLKIKQEGKKKLCPKCNTLFPPNGINKHKELHKGKFYFFQSNLSSIQINQIMKKKHCFDFYDLDELSNLDQIKRNKKIKDLSQVANQNKNILCFLSRFEKELSLHTTRLKFWSFPKKPNNLSNKANFFSRHNCDIKQIVQINNLFKQNESKNNPETLYNLLKLNLNQRTKLYVVFEYLQKIGTFRFVNFNVKTKHEQKNTFNKRAKINVQNPPNCLQIKKTKFNFIFNYFDELKVINVQKHLNISLKKRKNGIFSGKYFYLDIDDIERVSEQFHMVHQIDTIFNCVSANNHNEIMVNLFKQIREKFGANFYSITNCETKKFYGCHLLNVQKPIMNYILNDFVKNNKINADSSIIDSTKHFIKKYYVPYEIHCFKKDCSTLLNNTCIFKASKVKHSKEYYKLKRFEKKKIIKNKREWLMLQNKFNKEYPEGGNDEQVKNFIQKEMKIKKEIKKDFKTEVNTLSSYVPVDCSSMTISEKKELPNWSDFITNARENFLEREAKALRTKKYLETRFRIRYKFENESFYEFSRQCYLLLCKTERTVDNKINEKAISKRIFEKIYNEAVETNDMMDNLLFCYKKATNIMTACYRFDQYLKQNNFDQSVTVW